MTLVSFVVLTLNNVSTIRTCIDSILKQKYDSYEVIVVDAGSSDGTLEALNEYPNVRTCVYLNSSIGAARQFGVYEADGEYVAFIDSDCELPREDWLEKMMNPFIHPKTACSWALGAFRKDYPSITRYSILCHPYRRMSIPDTIIDRNYIPVGTGHTILRKSAINEVGGFKDLPSGEDVELTKTLVDTGYSLVHVDNCDVYHYHTTTFGGFMKKYQRDVSATITTKTRNVNHKDYILENLIFPIGTCVRGLVKDRDSAWLWHPIVCYAKAFTALRCKFGI